MNKKKIKFTGLHVHSHYSLRDGITKVKDIVKHCVDNNYSACCITDHGSMGSAISLYFECKTHGIKPIIGSEFYVIDNRENIKTEKKDHIILIAKNLQGFRNLINITTDAANNGFYKKPTTDYDYIFKHSEGLICLTACAAGRASKNIIKGDNNSTCIFLSKLQGVFGDDLYVELIMINYDHYENEIDTDGKPIKDTSGKVIQNFVMNQVEINKQLFLAAKRVGIKTVVTNDSHYLKDGDCDIHDIVTLLSSGKTFKDRDKGDGWVFSSRDLYYKAIDDLFKDWDDRFHESFSEDDLNDSLDNIEEIIDKIEDYKFDQSMKYPKLAKNKDEAKKIILTKCLDSLERIGKIDDKKYIDRLSIELSTLYRLNYLDYFLIVDDIIRYAKSMDKHGIGAGRGSVSGSLIAFLMGITYVDPLKWGLFFERFINRNRCFVGDTKVLMSDKSYKKIKDVVVGDFVISSDGIENNVSNCMSQKYVGKMMKITIQDEIFICTPHHKWYVELQNGTIVKKMAKNIDIHKDRFLEIYNDK